MFYVFNMAYLLLIAVPIVMSASSFVLRKQTRLVIAVASATALTQIALVAQLPVDEPARLLGLTLTLDPLSRLFLLAFLGVGALSFLATWRLPHGENFVPIAQLILGMVCAILLLLQEPFTVSLLLMSAGVMMYMAFALVNIYRPGDVAGRVSPAHLILGLLAVGFGLRLAAVPFHSWLPDMAQDAAPMVSVIVVAVINVTSLLFLI